MHYTVDSHVIESELAAKSYKQPNKHILKYITQLPKYKKILDYGCGRLRYEIPLSKHADEIFAVDSEEQVSRINEFEQTSDIVSQCSCNVNLCSLGSSNWKKQKYDLVFCTNVLSAIPFEEERIELLKNAKKVLNKSGYIFISVQYRNSYFSKYAHREDAFAYQDGWMIKRTSEKCYFYALLKVGYIVSLCKKAGFTKCNVKKKDSSCFIEARI